MTFLIVIRLSNGYYISQYIAGCINVVKDKEYIMAMMKKEYICYQSSKWQD